jgi:hypothetical protein
MVQLVEKFHAIIRIEGFITVVRIAHHWTLSWDSLIKYTHPRCSGRAKEIRSSPKHSEVLQIASFLRRLVIIVYPSPRN